MKKHPADAGCSFVSDSSCDSEVQVDIIEKLIGGLFELVVAQVGARSDLFADAVDQVCPFLWFGSELTQVLRVLRELDAVRTPSPTTASDFLSAGLTPVRGVNTDPTHSQTRCIVDG